MGIPIPVKRFVSKSSKILKILLVILKISIGILVYYIGRMAGKNMKYYKQNINNILVYCVNISFYGIGIN